MILWFVLGLYQNQTTLSARNFLPLGGSLILFALLCLLGWQVFGSLIKN